MSRTMAFFGGLGIASSQPLLDLLKNPTGENLVTALIVAAGLVLMVYGAHDRV